MAAFNLFGETWIGGQQANPNVSLNWQVMTFASGGWHIPGTGWRLGRAHHAVMESTGFITRCGRTIKPTAAFVHPTFFTDDGRQPNACKRCNR